MVLAFKISLGVIGAGALVTWLEWFGNPRGIKERIFPSQIIKTGFLPEWLANLNIRRDYGLAVSSINVITLYSVCPSAWETPASNRSLKAPIMNHALGKILYGALGAGRRASTGGSPGSNCSRCAPPCDGTIMNHPSGSAGARGLP